MHHKYHINYSSHKKYKHIKVSLLSRVKENIFFIKSLIVSLVALYKGKQFPYNFSSNELSSLPENYKKLEKDGVLGITDKKLSNKLKDILENQISAHRQELKPDKDRRLADCIKSLTQKDNELILKEIEDEVLKNPSFREVLELYFNGKNPSLRVALMHINSENDERVLKHSHQDEFDDELSLFHVDTNLNTFKCMIYLNDVECKENGAFEYVKTSHKDYDFSTFLLRRVIRKLHAFERDDLSKKKLMSYLKIFRKKNEFTDFSKNSELGCFIKDNSEIFMHPHNIVIFNPLGLHRGGRVFKGERLALQLVFCCDDFSWRII